MISVGRVRDEYTAKDCKYFTPEEFIRPLKKFNGSIVSHDFSQSLLDPRMFRLLDRFRHLVGTPLLISPVEGAIGRYLGEASKSQHNIDMWGESRAVDVMLLGSERSYEELYHMAVGVGFTGVGIYPQWKPHRGLHLDIRLPQIASWIQRDGKYLGWKP